MEPEPTQIPVPSVETYTFKLRTASNIDNIATKRHIAKFPDGTEFDFAKWPQPLKMVAEIVKSKEELPAVPLINMDKPKNIRRLQLERYFEKKKALQNKKDERMWHLEDADGGNAYDGQIEGGQTANYALFMMEGNEFRVYPVEDWYNFKQRKHFKIPTLEEAEAIIHNRKHTVDRWMVQKLNKPSELTTVGADGPLKHAKKEEEEDDDLAPSGPDFSVLGRLDKSTKKKKKASGNMEDGDEDVYANGDDEEVFDREEKEEEPDLGEDPNVFSDDDEDLVEEIDEDKDDKKAKDAENANELTEAGKELNTLLKNKKKEEDEFQSEESSSEEEEVLDEDSYAYNLGGKGAHIKSESGVATATTTTIGQMSKRPLSSNAKEAPSKKVKQETTVIAGETTTGQATPTGPVEEEEVRKALLVMGKVKTKQLINRFKNRLTDQVQKSRFANMVKKLGQIVEEHGEKFLILKEEYRGGLKIGK